MVAKILVFVVLGLSIVYLSLLIVNWVVRKVKEKKKGKSDVNRDNHGGDNPSR